MIRKLSGWIFLCFISFVPSEGSAATLQDLYAAGQEYYEQGQYQQAIEQYEKAVEINPNFAPLYNALGLAHQETATPLSDVIWFFKVATDIDPEYTEAYVNLCRAHAEAQQFEKARDACLAALEIVPTMGSAELQLAWVYLMGLKQPAQAIRYFQSVLAKVREPSVYYGLGLAYVEAGDHARALETITTLRGLEEHDFATRLEDFLRSQTAAPGTQEPSQISLPQRTEGTLIEARPPTPQPPPARSAPVSGQMRIRLQGSLFGSDE